MDDARIAVETGRYHVINSNKLLMSAFQEWTVSMLSLEPPPSCVNSLTGRI